MSDSLSIGIPSPSYRLPDTAHVGRVRLAVSNLERSLSFYSDVIGLALLKESKRDAQFGAAADGRVLLEWKRFLVYGPSVTEAVSAFIT